MIGEEYEGEDDNCGWAIVGGWQGNDVTSDTELGPREHDEEDKPPLEELGLQQVHLEVPN